MRRPFTLLETLIAFALATGLISLLLGFIYQAHLTHKQNDVSIQHIRNSYALHQRLSQVLPETTKILQTEPFVFIYNNGIDKNPLFSSTVLACLYLEKNQLILATWPNPNRWEERPHRAEIVANDIDTLSFEFFEPPGWSTSWEDETLPAMIRIHANDEQFTFPCIAVDKPVRFYD